MHSILFYTLILAASPVLAETPELSGPTATQWDGDADTKTKSRRPPTELSLGVRLDCLHDFNQSRGASQACITVTGLRVGLIQRISAQLMARIRLDPFGTPDAGREDSPVRTDLPSVKNSVFSLIDDYGFVWTPRSNLDVGFESYDGATRLPRVTGLALEHPFDDPGWRQTAVTVTYKLAALPDLRVRFAAGNGEGENGKNYDPQQYFGFDLSASIIRGLGIRLGVSQDANSVGSEQYEWLSERFRSQCGIDRSKEAPRLGYQTQRVGAALVLDGSLPALPGFKLALAGQNSTLRDLDKARTSYMQASDYEGCPQLDLNYLFVETQPGGEANTVKKSVYGLGVALTLRNDYLIAGSFSTRSIDTDRVQLFQSCGSYAGTTCLTPREQRKSYSEVSEDAITFGAGFQPAPGLKLTAEYARLNYNRKYAKLFFSDQNDKTSAMREVFNARLAYDWL